MYRRPKFLEVLLDIRQEMAREADYDVDLFAELVRNGRQPGPRQRHSINGDEPSDDRRASRAKVKKQPANGRGR
jgi:hypothetical protein